MRGYLDEIGCSCSGVMGVKRNQRNPRFFLSVTSYFFFTSPISYPTPPQTYTIFSSSPPLLLLPQQWDEVMVGHRQKCSDISVGDLDVDSIEETKDQRENIFCEKW